MAGTEEITMLLVEDNPDEEFLTRRVLKKFPVLSRIDVVKDGVEALRYLTVAENRAQPRFVLLDLKLPRVDGVDVLREMRKREETRDIPVVVLTSSDHERDMEACGRLGAAHFLQKPLDAGRMSEVLDRLGITARVA
ncbi:MULTISPECIES: response regulator [Geobacter]|uniref:Chemotaxis protein CheY n=2 Tax=Geobacter TaxID=28231 RepID=A0A0C1U1U0_9BACT|nr:MULTISPECIES: response regulator [Geobacter]ANA39935.1 hypothetical protein A2G06_05910 [Geobacter anodireducens]KIE41780.1 chemotaxis protein CheY [Geobacter soli]MBE2887912.1 response regulator [Geobacter anodireducens]HMN01482.1 response regulator [Geobacter anodireducens]